MTLKNVMDAYPSLDIVYFPTIATISVVMFTLLSLYHYIIEPYYVRKRGEETKKSALDTSVEKAEKLLVGVGFIAALGVMYIVYFTDRLDPVEEWNKAYLQPYIEYGGEMVKQAVVDVTISKSPIYDDIAILIPSDNATIISIRDIKFREDEYTALPYIESREYEKGFEDFLKQKGIADKYQLPSDILILPKGYFEGTSS